MQLNPDCIRDILLEIESVVTFDDFFTYETSTHPSSGLLSRYSPDEILYHIRQCNFHGFLYSVDWVVCGDVTVQDLTPEGHQFLANIRSNTIWNKTKSIAGKIGSYSVDVLSQIAVNVVSEIIKQSMYPAT